MALKICFEQQIYRLSKLPETYDELLDTVKAKNTQVQSNRFSLHYMDKDLNKHFINSERDYKTLLANQNECTSDSMTRSVKIYVFEQPEEPKVRTRSCTRTARGRQTELKEEKPVRRSPRFSSLYTRPRKGAKLHATDEDVQKVLDMAAEERENQRGLSRVEEMSIESHEAVVSSVNNEKDEKMVRGAAAPVVVSAAESRKQSSRTDKTKKLAQESDSEYVDSEAEDSDDDYLEKIKKPRVYKRNAQDAEKVENQAGAEVIKEVIEKSTPQMDFVSPLDSMTYITRLLDRVKLRTKDGEHVAVLFLYFKKQRGVGMQYNDIMNKIKAIEGVSKEDMAMMKAVQSRERLFLGGVNRESCKSMTHAGTSDGLFELVKELDEKFKVKEKDVLIRKYGVTLVLEKANRVGKVVEAVSDWCGRTGVKLNGKNSAVMEFMPRTHRKLMVKESEIMGLKVVEEYRFLGLWLDRKLTMERQVLEVREKVQKIVEELKKVDFESQETRREAWRIFVEPIFEVLMPGYVTEDAMGRKKEVAGLVRRTYRDLMGYAKNLGSLKVEKEIGHGVEERAGKAVKLYRRAWGVRGMRMERGMEWNV